METEPAITSAVTQDDQVHIANEVAAQAKSGVVGVDRIALHVRNRNGVLLEDESAETGAIIGLHRSESAPLQRLNSRERAIRAVAVVPRTPLSLKKRAVAHAAAEVQRLKRAKNHGSGFIELAGKTGFIANGKKVFSVLIQLARDGDVLRRIESIRRRKTPGWTPTLGSGTREASNRTLYFELIGLAADS